MLEAKLDKFAMNLPSPETISVLEFMPSGVTSSLVLEEEVDNVPAHSATEYAFQASAGSIATRADDPAATPSRVAPSTRYKVRIVNTHATDRLYVARGSNAQTAAQDTTYLPEVVEADFGIWEDFLDPAIPIYVRPQGSNSIYVRMIQYATT